MISLDDVQKNIEPPIRDKLTKLVSILRSFEVPIAVLFSGGLDSSVVAAVSALTLSPKNVIALTALSPTYPEEDFRWAKEIASIFKFRHIIIESDEINDYNFISNPPNRCYFCKKNLLIKAVEVVRMYGAKVIVDGTNASDLYGHRPGYIALMEFKVRSPLAEAGLSKEEVRLLAKALKLPNWSKPPMACLASRIPYGEPITVEKLRRIASAEAFIKSLTGIELIRVRDHNHIARIEVDPKERRKFFNEEIMDRISEELKKLGYKYVALELSGYRSGSLDEVLTQKIVPEQELKKRY